MNSLLDIKWLTVEEVATALRVSKMTVYRMVHDGELPSLRSGRQFRIPEQAVIDHITKGLDASGGAR